MLATTRWWRLRTIPALWATFMTPKYCSRSHLVSEKYSSGDSHALKKLRKIREKAKSHIQLLINTGNSCMWWDNCSRKGPLALLFSDAKKSHKVLVKEFIHNGEWNTKKLRDTFLEDTVEHIRKVNVGKQDISDQAIWDLTENGRYSNKTTQRVQRY